MARGRRLGPVTGAASIGGGLGAALAEILVYIFPALEPIESPIAIVFTLALAALGGYLVPSENSGEPVVNGEKPVPVD